MYERELVGTLVRRHLRRRDGPCTRFFAYEGWFEGYAAARQVPSNLQGLYEVRYSGDKLDANDAFKLLEAMQDIQNHPIPDRYKEQ